MRGTVAVLDVGCFSARLLGVDRGGSLLEPVLSHKTRLRLDRSLDASGRLRDDGVESVVSAVRVANEVAARHGVDELFCFATSSIRDSANADEVVERVEAETGRRLRFFSGTDEARLAYRAARVWFGAGVGPLSVLDVGGGTLELAAGHGLHADFARSLPLGARETTRAWRLDTERPSEEAIEALRSHAIEEIRDALGEDEARLREFGVVGCSKVLRQLAVVAGRRRKGTIRTRELHLEDVRELVPRLAALPASRRSEVRGISRPRARQALAGAVVAEALLTVFGGPAAICPWSTTHGVLLALLHDADELRQSLDGRVTAA
ncbi:Ppx/GppA phosphatase family protein [Saccharomonospora sp. NB11]|jgi:exopolyphosphatase/guanosine-5'-triphosphate,3'-diphosphate pyrophosphatase|uniref:Ppx/GppA phosphatase family protein n=1 Tax=Saccharomonospora sp. NB11 TaxID=1642298 RepID=UPI0018D0C68F|nr:exopolyphosphatase [Saccharomonospora sp. NB11]